MSLPIRILEATPIPSVTPIYKPIFEKCLFGVVYLFYFISTLTLPTPSAPTLLPYTENLDTHLLQWLHQELLSSITFYKTTLWTEIIAAECGNENHFSHILERTGYLKPAAGKAPPPFFFKEYLKKNNKSSNYYWIYLDVGISKIMKIWFMPTNAGNLLLLLWCCCWCSLLGSKGVRLSPDIPGTAGKGGLSWERPPCLPLAGCVTFAKSHSPLWASVGFWNEGVEFDSQVPLELWNRMSYIRNSG